MLKLGQLFFIKNKKIHRQTKEQKKDPEKKPKNIKNLKCLFQNQLQLYEEKVKFLFL